MTSGGGTRVLPNYGPVSGAKAALSPTCASSRWSWCRKHQVNAVRAGVTIRRRSRNPRLQSHQGGRARAEPRRRLTTTEDVARAIVASRTPSPTG